MVKPNALLGNLPLRQWRLKRQSVRLDWGGGSRRQSAPRGLGNKFRCRVRVFHDGCGVNGRGGGLIAGACEMSFTNLSKIGVQYAGHTFV